MKLLTFIFFFISCLNGMAQQTDSVHAFSNARALINKFITEEKVPSISIAVVKGKSIIWEEGFGYADIEHKRKATIHTPYYLASLSKSITATGVMKLAERRLINLDSPINNYLTSGKVRSFMWDTKGATVRRVMSHTSGLTTFNSWCREDSSTCAKNDDVYISRYAVLISSPGKRFDYTNLGYGLLDRMISQVSNSTFPDYMKREIFTPLSMKNTYVATFLSDSGRAIRYSSADLTRFEFDFSHSYSAGASFIYSSVHDLALFSILHLNNAGRNAILSERSVTAMQDTVARNDSDHYGLGWWIRNDFNGYKGVLAQGGTFFANAWLQLIPSEDIAVVILANSGGGDMSALLNEILSELLPEFKRNLAHKAPILQNQHTDQFLPPASQWRGLISTYKRDIPITFHFNGAKSSSATLSTKRIELKNVETKRDWYSFSIEGDLGLEDTGRGPYNLTFYLNQNVNVLYGSVETSSSIHPDTPQLAYWVKLQQVK